MNQEIKDAAASQQVQPPQSEATQALKAKLESLHAALTVKNPPQNVSQESKPNIEEILRNDFSKIDKLVKAGIIEASQGKEAMQEVVKKAFDTVNNASEPAPDNAFAEFEKATPDFFNSDARNAVKDYISTVCPDLSKDDISKISALITSLEKSAVDSYAKNEQISLDANESAKKRLSSAALSGAQAHGNSFKLYTLAEITKMPPAEFRAHEKEIMKQFSEGKLK
ncbi:MAG: hypothetical protein PHN38_09680 [Sulfurospirillaceae bacterium]|nr:hypothetical protein [Sulfurospirillaceae bacterium]